MIMQAPATVDPVQSLVAMVTAIGALVGVIGAIITAVASMIKSKSHDPQITAISDKANVIGQIATAFGQKTAEHEKDAQTFAQVITALSPEAKAELEKHQKDINYFTERANVSQQQLSRLLALVPKEASANAMTDLPREDQKTLAVVNSTAAPKTTEAKG